MKVIFLDIDGPLIPSRAALLPNNFGSIWSTFDSVAVAMINKLIKKSGAKIVLSSSWRKDGLSYCRLALEVNGISCQYLHADWRTPIRPDACRDKEILEWLYDHEGITHYVAIDDMELQLPRAVKVTTQDGMLWDHFVEASKLLDCHELV